MRRPGRPRFRRRGLIRPLLSGMAIAGLVVGLVAAWMLFLLGEYGDALLAALGCMTCILIIIFTDLMQIGDTRDRQ